MPNNIWLLMAIPLLATIVLFTKFKHKVVWWEMLILWGGTALAILISQIAVENIGKTDTEWWGFNGITAQYEEPFEYWTTCTYQCGQTCSGTGKNRTCYPKYCTRPCTEWAGDVSYIYDQTGDKRRISNSLFEEIAGQRWQNRTFVELNREQRYNIETDGDMYTSKWPETWQTSVPIVVKHSYENRVNNSSTITFREVSEGDKEYWGLYDYPAQNRSALSLPALLDNGEDANWSEAADYFEYLNGIMGPKVYGRLWVLIMHNADRSAAEWQKDYWKNGNKNELILCIGVADDNTIAWGEVFGWTEVEEIKVEARDYIEQKMGTLTEQSLLQFAAFCEDNIIDRFVKPEFTEKYSHLSIEPSMTAKVVVGFIVLIICIGLCCFVVMNEANDEDHKVYDRSNQRRRHQTRLNPRNKGGLVNRRMSRRRY